MEKKIYMVLSVSNDETSASNHAFYDYEKAFEYWKLCEESYGFSMKIISVPVVE